MVAAPYRSVFRVGAGVVSERDCISRRLQDHQRVEGCDLVVTIDVRCGVPAAGGCESERDDGVGGGDTVA